MVTPLSDSIMSRLYTWTNDQTGIEFNMTSENMEEVYNSAGVYPEELAETLTGITVDEYADRCELLDMDDTEDDDYKLCEAFHRLLNVTYPGDLDCEKNFKNG